MFNARQQCCLAIEEIWVKRSHHSQPIITDKINLTTKYHTLYTILSLLTFGSLNETILEYTVSFYNCLCLELWNYIKKSYEKWVDEWLETVFFSFLSCLVLPGKGSTMAHELLTGLLEEVVLKYTQTRSKLKLQINVSRVLLQSLDFPSNLSASLDDSWRTKSFHGAWNSRNFFFLFPKRSCSCFARELGGREDLSTCIHGASASANKVFPEEGGSGRRLCARTTTSILSV